MTCPNISPTLPTKSTKPGDDRDALEDGDDGDPAADESIH